MKIKEIKPNMYFCKTRAEFISLIEQIFVNDNYTFTEIMERINRNDYPVKYPAIIIPDKTLFQESGAVQFYIIYNDDFLNNY